MGTRRITGDGAEAAVTEDPTGRRSASMGANAEYPPTDHNDQEPTGASHVGSITVRVGAGGRVRR